MAKSSLKSFIPVWIQNVIISLVLAVIVQISLEFWNKIGETYSAEIHQQIDINIYGLFKMLFLGIFAYGLVIFFSLSFLRSIYSTFTEVKNAETE